MRNDIDKDLYDILGVDRTATKAEIKSAYRYRARECHPDVASHDPDAERKFKELTFANEVLSDDEKRRDYDTFGLEGLRRGRGVDFGGFTSFSDLIDMFFGDNLNNPFMGRSGSRARARGNDIETGVKVSLAEVSSGAEREIEVNRRATCAECEGTGMMPGTFMSRCTACNGAGQVSSQQRSLFGTFIRSATCPNCQGRGEVITEPCGGCKGDGRRVVSETLKVSIPPGVERGDYLRLKGKGEAGLRGGVSGDLYVVIDVKTDPRFERDERNLLTEVTVDMVDAALGGEVMLPTLDGEHRLKFHPGTQPGDILRVKGKGVPPRGGGRKGDILVRVKVSVPDKLSAEQKRLLEKFRG